MTNRSGACWVLCAAALSVGFLLLNMNAAGQAADSPSQNPVQPETGSGAAKPKPAPLSDEDLADSYIMSKEYDKATTIYRRLVERNPHNAVYLNKLGICYLNQAQLGSAMHYFEKSAKADPRYAVALNNLGVVHYQRKKYSKAIKAYEKALSIDPHAASFYGNLGYAYFASKHYAEAMDAFQKALALDPGIFSRNPHSSGTTLQDSSVQNRGLFDFLMAKMFAQQGNLERCVYYLHRARDEHYASLASVKTDPAFAAVSKEPAVLELIEPAAEGENKP
jgi:tetratricopeptide (TPR) repeat protein